uniref:Uncharacterized protein n=2 Tax=Leishmania guyanensis species complex TaxID=38579 RepID=A0A1E1IQU7_LEIGU
MHSSCSSPESRPSQHSGTSTSTTSSAHSSDQKRTRQDDGMSVPTTQSCNSSEDAQHTSITPAPSSVALARRSDELQNQRPRTAIMENSNVTIPTLSENSVDGPPRLPSLPSSLPHRPHVALVASPTPNAAVEDHAASAPSPSFSWEIAYANSNPRRNFVVMLNHKRMIVPAEHPFLIPRDLISPRATRTVAEDDQRTTDASDVGNCVVAAEGAARHPVHCYGDRPVLLLDCTGALRQRRLRRQRRLELQSRASKLVAARADLLRTKNLWSMRCIRARRRNKEQWLPEPALCNAGGHADRGGGDSTVSAPSDAARGGVPAKHLMSALSVQRKAITREVKEVRRELLTLLQEKRTQAATRDGCVLMLPSPETGEVRLLPGHHYRTVCFVGDELRDVLPSDARDTDTATVQRRQRRAPPLREPASEGTTCALSDEGGAEGEHTLAKETKRPLWAMAELLGYVLYLRQCHRNPDYHSRRGATLGSDSIDYQEVREGRVDYDKIAATISYDMVDDYLALPTCEIAMYREWAIDKFKLLPL